MAAVQQRRGSMTAITDMFMGRRDEQDNQYRFSQAAPTQRRGSIASMFTMSREDEQDNPQCCTSQTSAPVQRRGSISMTIASMFTTTSRNDEPHHSDHGVAPVKTINDKSTVPASKRVINRRAILTLLSESQQEDGNNTSASTLDLDGSSNHSLEGNNTIITRHDKRKTTRALLDGTIRKPKKTLKDTVATVMAAKRLLRPLKRAGGATTVPSSTRYIEYSVLLGTLELCRHRCGKSILKKEEPETDTLKSVSFATDPSTCQVWTVDHEVEKVDSEDHHLIWWSSVDMDERYDQDEAIAGFIHPQYGPLLQQALESTKASRKTPAPLSPEMVRMDLKEAALCSVARGLESEMIPQLRDLILSAHSKAVLLNRGTDEDIATMSLKYSRPSRLIALKLAELDEFQTQLRPEEY